MSERAPLLKGSMFEYKEPNEEANKIKNCANREDEQQDINDPSESGISPEELQAVDHAGKTNRRGEDEMV